MQDLSSNLILGTDLVFVPRITANYRKYGDAFLSKLLTDAELRYCKGSDPVRESLLITRAAGRIAVKEAVSKALGVGINGLGWSRGAAWREIEVTSQRQSPPGLRLHGRALNVSDRLGVRAWRLSLSHDGDYAAATVIGLLTVTP